MARLSIVIPVYNGDRYIDRLIDCFRNQSVKNFKLIFVNDGSTDGSLVKLQSYEDRTDLGFDVTVINKPQGGVSSARNEGLKAVDTDYVSFVDVDDRVSGDYAETFGTVLGDFDLLYFQSERVPETGPFPDDENELGITRINSGYMLDLIAYDPTRYGVYNFFARTDFIRDNKLEFAEGYAYYEDYDFLYRATALAKDIAFSGHRLYFYVISDDSAVANFRLERLSNIELLEKDIPFLKQYAPKFVDKFESAVIPRIYWSVLWQSALAFSLPDALKFANAGQFKEKLKTLEKNENRKVSLSTILFEICPPAFFAAAKLLGRSRSKLKRTDVKPFIEYFR